MAEMLKLFLFVEVEGLGDVVGVLEPTGCEATGLTGATVGAYVAGGIGRICG